MTIYEKQNSVGEAWFRNSDGTKLSGNIALSAFSNKYPILYDISSNSIIKLDVIQDVLIIKTQNGFSVDKFKISDNGIPVPVDNYNNSVGYLTKWGYTSSFSMDHWYDEKNKTLYTFCGGIDMFPDAANKFTIDIYTFDITQSRYLKSNQVTFNIVADTITSIDPIKLCYNVDTQTFNVSTLFSTTTATNTNLVSVNIKNVDGFEISSLNIVIPNNLSTMWS